MHETLLTTDQTVCAGCNKCIAECPVNANTARYEDGKNIVTIDYDRCILCGECIRVCDHGARTFTDDTARFFADLQAGETISMVVAPAARHNFPNYEQVFGWLKSLGVKNIYDVSFGADITTWAYLRTLKQQNPGSIIAQPCPVVVSYIETYKPDLIPRLAPIHSPAMCEAIYLKKYKGAQERLAFLSPCIAKAAEFYDPNTEGLISYNVTIDKLSEYIREHQIRLSAFPACGFDDDPCGLGLTFSRPGGLAENVRYYMGDDLWIRQKEGIHELVEYFDQYEDRDACRRPLPVLVDALNCKDGCNLGTAAGGATSIDDVDIYMNQLKKEKITEAPDPSGQALLEHFDRTLHLEDFSRSYTVRDHVALTADPAKVEEVFLSLGKKTTEQRNINCYSCGYGSCQKFADAVSTGHNDLENCVFFARHKLEANRHEFDGRFDNLEGNVNSILTAAENLKSAYAEMEQIFRSTSIIAINAHIESAHAGPYGVAFSVVASEIKNLADKSSSLLDTLRTYEEDIETQVEDFQKALSQVQEEMRAIMR